MKWRTVVVATVMVYGLVLPCACAADAGLTDKTLVVWASPATLDQRGGTALTVDNGSQAFDGVVFGEVEPRRWMPGSDTYSRTDQNQAGWPEEQAGPDTFVQVAISYRGREIQVYRDGVSYARYTVQNPPQPFGACPVVLFGRRHLDARDKDRSFQGRILDARIYDTALDGDTIAGLVPGNIGEGPRPWAWWDFGESGVRERTGRFNAVRFIGEAGVRDGCLVLPGEGATLVCSRAPEAGESGTAGVPGAWSIDGPVPDAAVASARLLRERLLADPYRPRYHFSVPEGMGMPGDPNGAFHHAGRYHLMYLYERAGTGFCWGHVSSTDLVHWRHHPDAIGPGGGDEGCFSGGAFVDDDGTAYLSYWMLWGARGIGIAASRDPYFEQWTKSAANPVIRSTEFGLTEISRPGGGTFFYGSADPSNIWKKDGRHYMLTGNLLVLNKVGRADDAPPEEQGDRLYLFVSDDLENWEYLHVFYERNPEWTDRSEDNMCPSFLPLPSGPEGGPPSGKHLLLFISHNMGCQYYIGDYRDDRFFPESHGRMTWTDNTYFAPEALVDGRGRQIMWAWLTDNPPDDKARGWSGVYGLPRALWLGDDGTLRMAPVRELETLRGAEQTWTGIVLAGGESRPLEGITGDACELSLDIEPGDAERCGLKVRASADGEEETLLYYDARAEELVFDSTRSGLPVRNVVERAPLALAPGEPLRLRVFVDRPVVEVYANDRQAVCRRVFPTRADSVGVALFAEGGRAAFNTIRAWHMMPAQGW